MKAFSSVGGGVKGASLKFEGGVIWPFNGVCEGNIGVYYATGEPALRRWMMAGA